MKRVVLLFLATGLVTPQAPAFDGARAWTHLQRIVEVGPRPAGSDALARTRAYIQKELEDFGQTVELRPFTAETPAGPISMTNLVTRVKGESPTRVLITGHYDTKLFKDFVFVGANDGGSSAAFLIEFARVLSRRTNAVTYDIVWFDGEEAVVEWIGTDNTYGSRHFVEAERAAGRLDSIGAMVLVDMIGGSGLVVERDVNSTPWLTDLIWSAARQAGHEKVFVQSATSIEDDHLPFIAAGIPAVDIIGFNHYYRHWHQPTDTMANVSQRSLQVVGDVLLAALPAIEKRVRQ